MGFSTPKNKFIKPISGLININVKTNLTNYPEEMKQYRQWVCWSFIKKEDGTTAKSPVYINKHGQLGLSKWRLENLLSFEDASRLCEENDLIHGVGFVFTTHDPFVFIDFDKLKPDDDRYKWFTRRTFAEWSQSGKGLHMIVKGKIRKAHKPTSGLVEIYATGRFCAMTGKLAGKETTDIISDQMLVDTLIEAYPMNENKETDRSTSVSFKLPAEIKEGSRNDTMWKYACSLNAKMSDQKEIHAQFHKVNKENCKPPLEDVTINDMLERASQFIRDNRILTGKELVEDYVYICSDEMFVHKRTLMAYTKPNFNLLNISYKSDKGKLIASDIFMNHPEREFVDEKTWIPTGLSSAVDNGTHIIEHKINDNDDIGIKKFNTWKGIPCTPRKGSVDRWLKLLTHLVSDSQEREVILDWLAAVVQHPEKKVNWQIVHTGTHGCGKDSLYKPIGMILGSSAGTVTHEELISGFGGYMAQKKFLLLEEIFKPGHRDFDVSSKLKTMAATTAGNMLTINEKFMRPYTQADVLMFVILSNHDDCLYVEKGERRYFGIKSDVQPLPSQFYADYYKWLNEERGYQCIFNYLLDRNISEFDYSGMPFESSATKGLKATSYMDYQIKLIDMIESESPPFDKGLIALEKVREVLAVYGYTRTTDKGVVQILQERGFEKIRGVKKIGKKVTTCPRYYTNIDEIISGSPREKYEFWEENKAKTV